MQIAGTKCKVCEREIVLSKEGKFCARCGTALHIACEPAAACRVCGDEFQQYQPPKPEPLSEAVIPRAIRPVGSRAPATAILLTVLVAGALVLLAWYALMSGMGDR
jgi:hypothetical protein